MKNHFLIFAIILFLSISCTTDKKKDKSNSQIAGLSDQITLISAIKRGSSKNEIFLAYPDNFDNDIDLYNNNDMGRLAAKISATSPVFIKDVSPAMMEYIIYPGDSVTIERGVNNSRYLSFKTNDSIRNNELDFFIALYETAKGFRSAKILKDSVQIPNLTLTDKLLEQNFNFQMKEDKLTKNFPRLAEGYYAMLLTERKAFLEIYSKSHPVSAAFVMLIKEYFQYSYYEQVIKTARAELTKNGRVNNELSEKVASLHKYFDNKDYSFMPVYRSSAYLYAQYLSKLKNGGSDDAKKLLETIKTNFKGSTREYLIFKTANNLLVVNSDKDSPIITEYLALATNQSFIRNIRETLASNATISITETELEDYEGKKLKLKEVIDSYKGYVVYVDLWASWCLPCIREMPYSVKIKEKLKSEKIKFIYLSFDAKMVDWRNSNAVNHDSNSFIVLGNFKSLLAKQYKISTIPRYIIFDKKGVVINSNAKRPSEKGLEFELRKHL